ncbi:AlpA family transcriptional regulator [Parafrankia sp. BMG5.11]|uniref:helix-turn-helix transcriptional regulator n=1 Tax=Parafrankia sp. BMG5.11 TaxID=222540 RepID=UPI00103F2F07|nr:AlpA family phage regulatory protein [Parafrankia sp. BMG5.11]TCJ39201.1 AlpA family phage regulatory protein [Parafrankia sp. BMG5.11]
MTTILRLPAVMERVGLSRSTIYAMMSEGRFPRAVKLGERAIGWPADRIETFISEREPA